MPFKIKILFILISFLLVQHSEAQLRCVNLFAGDKNSFAKVIDVINLENNQQIFKVDLDAILHPDFAEKNIWQQVALRKKAFSLGRKLKELKDAGEWGQYEFDNFSAKLSKLSFLVDNQAMSDMTGPERIIFLQARHSALSKGLEKYFFESSTTSLSVRQKIYQWLLVVPFKSMWWRWVVAPFNIPKLNGSVITAEDAAALLWEGPEKRPDLIEKYSINIKDKSSLSLVNLPSTAQGKYYFNKLATAYNYGVFAVAVGLLPVYGYLSFTEIKAQGAAEAVNLLTPTLESSEQAAKVDYAQLRKDKDLQNSIELFKLKLNRDPTPSELNRIRERYEERRRHLGLQP